LVGYVEYYINKQTPQMCLKRTWLRRQSPLSLFMAPTFQHRHCLMSLPW